MNAETMAALERMTSPCRLYDDQDIADAALIRAHIERERGGERAKVMAVDWSDPRLTAAAPAVDFGKTITVHAIASGAHEEQQP